MAKIVIGLVGEMASGKDATKKYLESKYKAKHCKFSSPLRDVLDRLYIEKSRDNIINLSTCLRETFGQDLLAKIIKGDAEKIEADIVVVDGVRRIPDIKYLRELDNFILIKIEVDAKIRYERMKSRNENVGDDQKTFDDFMNDHKKETEVTVSEVMKQADFSLDNNGSFEDLYKQIDDIVGRISQK